MKEIGVLPQTQPIDILREFCMAVKITILKYDNKISSFLAFPSRKRGINIDEFFSEMPNEIQ